MAFVGRVLSRLLMLTTLALITVGIAPLHRLGAVDGITITRVNVSSSGEEADTRTWSLSFELSADGTIVAFESEATNLVPGDTNGRSDVFVRDLVTGRIERVSVASDSAQGNGPSGGVSLSDDGRFVAFHSMASNLVDGDTNETLDVFVHDRSTAITERVSVSSDGAQANGTSVNPGLSGDGNRVVFGSRGDNLVPGDSTNDRFDVFVHDRSTGTTRRMSVATDGSEADEGSEEWTISANGTTVAFISEATTLVPDDTNGTADAFLRDVDGGVTTRGNVAADGSQANSDSHSPTLDAAGTRLAFTSYASNLGTEGRDAYYDLFVKDLQSGTITAVVSHADDDIFSPQLATSGARVAFQTRASNLVPGDTTGVRDVFVHDLDTNMTRRVSVSSDGDEGNGDSSSPHLDAHGTSVVFGSWASNLVPDDTNDLGDVFVAEIIDETKPTICRGRVATVVSAGVIIGTDDDDVIAGSGGPDLIDGRGGDDIICGEGGPDVMVHGPGADTFDGGRGRDTVSYATSNRGVRVTIDGVADDGGPFEGDNVARSVEIVRGSMYRDTLIGSENDDVLRGLDGRDRLRGLSGDDRLYGGDGGDILHGGAGDDHVDGGYKFDRCRGGGGLDSAARCELITSIP